MHRGTGGLEGEPLSGPPVFSFSVLRWTSLHPPTSPSPPQSPPKATGGQGFKCHAWPSERPAPGSCLLGEARQETGRGREES